MASVYPDFPTNPLPPANDYGRVIFPIFMFLFFITLAFVSLYGNRESQKNNQHSHSYDVNSAKNDQQFCDNPDHFTFDNEGNLVISIMIKSNTLFSSSSLRLY